jgi:hypothetical protein
MMSYIRYALLAIVLLFAVTVALANRAPVTLALWPDSVTAILGFGFAVTLPLFVVVVGALGLGLLLGLIWEWLRERGIRVRAARLQRELAELRGPDNRRTQPPAASGPGDDILALVDGRKPAA